MKNEHFQAFQQKETWILESWNWTAD